MAPSWRVERRALRPKQAAAKRKLTILGVAKTGGKRKTQSAPSHLALLSGRDLSQRTIGL